MNREERRMFTRRYGRATADGPARIAAVRKLVRDYPELHGEAAARQLLQNVDLLASEAAAGDEELERHLRCSPAFWRKTHEASRAMAGRIIWG